VIHDLRHTLKQTFSQPTAPNKLKLVTHCY